MGRKHYERTEQGQYPEDRQKRGSHFEIKEGLPFEHHAIREHSSEYRTLSYQDGGECIGSCAQEVESAGAIWMCGLQLQAQPRDTPKELKPSKEPEVPPCHDESKNRDAKESVPVTRRSQMQVSPLQTSVPRRFSQRYTAEP